MQEIKCNKMILDRIIEHSKKPPVFSKSTLNFWKDEHISKFLLEAHLNPNWDAASRKPEIIDKTINWVANNYLKNKNSKILDLGCGPGLYTEKFLNKCSDFKITGIDFSKHSIKYAKDSAIKKKLNINYIYMNYLEMDYENEFDLIFMIYCDFGALNNDDRNN